MKQDPVSKQRSHSSISLQRALPEPRASASRLQAQGIGFSSPAWKVWRVYRPELDPGSSLTGKPVSPREQKRANTVTLPQADTRKV